MKQTVEKLFALVALVVIGLFSVTHLSFRGGFVRYPWASYVPFIGEIESAMMAIAMIFLVMWAVGEIR